jgi:putative NADPH-quinone reductase
MGAPHFLFLLASARRDGNTEALARAAARALPVEVEQRWLHLDDVPLPRFADLRHPTRSFRPPEGHEKALLEATLAATDLVIAAPLYWYSLPASAKLYLDFWTAWLRADGYDFKPRMVGKRLWGVCVSTEEDRTPALPLIDALRLSAEYMQMDWRGVLMGVGNLPGDIAQDSAALEAARTFFTRG